MKPDMNHSIAIPLAENNLAEVLAGMAIIGIAEIHAPGMTTAAWESNSLYLTTPFTEMNMLEHVNLFLENLTWNEGLGKPHMGVFSSSGIIGISPFMDFDNKGEPSVFKNFSGQVTTAKINAEQHDAIGATPTVSLHAYLSHTARNVSSWAFDWRTNSHSLDLGFSANDDKTSQYDPIYVAIEMLSVSALAFFLPAGALLNADEKIIYHLWRHSIQGSLVGAAFLGQINGLEQHSYQITRRPKSYGKGASYKYFPNAFPISSIPD